MTSARCAALHLLKGAADEQGRPKGNCSEWYNVDQALVKPPSFVQESDLDVFRALKRHSRKSANYGGNNLFGATGAALLEAVFATGRIWAGRADNATVLPLQRAAQRTGRLIWRNAAAGLAPLVVTEPPASVVMPTEPLYYLDVDRGEIGRVEVAHPEVVLDVLRLPPLTENELPVVAAALAEVAPELPTTLPGQTGELEELAAPLEPVLRIDTLTTWGHARHRDYEVTYSPTPYDYALAWFRYGDAELLPGATPGIVSLPDGRAVRLKRDAAAENAALAALERAGLKPVRSQWLHPTESRREGRQMSGQLLGLASEAAWTRFFAEQVPALREAGWRIECPADFRHRVLAVTNWDAQLEEDGNGWFALSLGIEVDGRRLELAPLLHQLFRNESRWLDPKQLERIRNDESVIVFSETGDRIAIPAQRIKPLARTLVDLFDAPERGALRVSRFDAPRLAEALDENWQTRGLQPLEDWHCAHPQCAGHQGAAAAAGAGDRTAAVPARRAGVAAASACQRAGRHPRRRHGARQDGADARAPAGREATPDASTEPALVVLPTR